VIRGPGIPFEGAHAAGEMGASAAGSIDGSGVRTSGKPDRIVWCLQKDDRRSGKIVIGLGDVAERTNKKAKKKKKKRQKSTSERRSGGD
jgi:hypothetical protein